MKHVIIIFCWVGVLVIGIFLRFDHLAKRPFHADEATGARITARRMESGGGQFDPKHYHGPLLGDLAIPLCKLRGENTWQKMRKTTLRCVPAVAGSLLLLTPLWWRRRFGDGPALLAAAFLATSPLLVYYSRTFIHESLLLLFGMLALISLTEKPRWGIPGVFIGLMFAAKESFAISLVAWAGAAFLIALENRRSIDRETLADAWRSFRVPASICLLTAALVTLAFYTHGFRHPMGAIDAVRTFFVYETVEGHDKPFAYYFNFLAVPKKSGGAWWFETPVLVFAVLAYALSFRRSAAVVKARPVIHFIAYSAVGHFLIYSIIGYKTPWLACLPWAHVCLLAGFCVFALPKPGLLVKFALALTIGAGLYSQFTQARRATGRFASDARNPYAYVPTRSDVERLATWLGELRAVIPAGTLEPAAVIGSDYWPLPWYLRSFDRTGYWPDPPEGIEKLPIVFALPDSSDAISHALEQSHAAVPRGLRNGVQLDVFIRNDIWKTWMETDSQ